jgi:hypothetical protein
MSANLTSLLRSCCEMLVSFNRLSLLSSFECNDGGSIAKFAFFSGSTPYTDALLGYGSGVHLYVYTQCRLWRDKITLLLGVLVYVRSVR